MKIFVISEMSIYQSLEMICKKKSIEIEECFALKTNSIKYDHSEMNSVLLSVDAIVFQSKNAIKYCNKNYKEIKERIELHGKESGVTNFFDIYCLGKYTAKKVKELVGGQPIYNAEKFSSEGIIESIEKKIKRGQTFIIIKGVGGRDYINRKLKENGVFVRSYDVYERIYTGAVIKNNDLREGNNYFIINSLTALNHINDMVKEHSKDIKKIAIVPDERFIKAANENLFDDYMIIENSASESRYIYEIEKYEEK